VDQRQERNEYLDTGIDWGDGVAIPIVIVDYYHKIMLPRWDRAGNPIEPSPMRAAEMAFVIHLLRYHYESPKGESRPSLGTIAAKMGISRVQAFRYKNALEKGGLIEVTYRDHATSIYHFHGLMIAAKAAAMAAGEYTEEMATAAAEIPPAVEVYHEVVEHWPVESLWDLIAAGVGDKPKELRRWREVVLRYIACGWNPQNLNGMLRYFADNEIPDGGSENGRNSGGKRKETVTV